jgi:hypothetical protein
MVKLVVGAHLAAVGPAVTSCSLFPFPFPFPAIPIASLASPASPAASPAASLAASPAAAGCVSARTRDP